MIPTDNFTVSLKEFFNELEREHAGIDGVADFMLSSIAHRRKLVYFFLANTVRRQHDRERIDQFQSIDEVVASYSPESLVSRLIHRSTERELVEPDKLLRLIKTGRLTG